MNHSVRALLLVVLLGSAAGGVGCATVRTRAPASIGVSVSNVVPTQATLLETTVAVTLRLTNESSQPLRISGGVFKLHLNGTYAGRAVTSEQLSIPALGTAAPTVTVYLENLVLMRKATELSNARVPVISYRLDCRFEAMDGEHPAQIDASTSGELDVSAFMPNAAAAPRS